MHPQTYIPSPSLQPFIQAYLIIESRDEILENKVLPGTTPVMVFRYKGQVGYRIGDLQQQVPAATISGLWRSGRMIRYEKQAGNILVLFKEAGAAAFIKEPLHELFEDSISLDQCDGYQRVSLVEEQLQSATGHIERIAVVERFLISHLQHHTPDSLVAAALQNIHATKGIIKIKELAGSLYISQDAFEKRFRRIAGVSPKQFSYIVRMKAVIKEVLKNQTLTDTALNTGYFDQPHFNKDFKLFTGQSPTGFLKSPVFW